MERSGHVIKRDDANYHADSSPPSHRSANVLRSSDQIRSDEDASPDEEPSAYGRVLRGEQTRRAVPYDIQTAEFDADVPLDGSQRQQASSDDNVLTAEELEKQKADWEAEWSDRLEAAREEAFEEGRQEGYAAAREELEDEFDDKRSTVEETVSQLQAGWQSYINESKPMLAQLTIEIAEYLLDADLPKDIRGVSSRSITQAIEELASGPPLTISLHPVDYLRLQEAGIVEQLESIHPELHWDSDAEYEEGDWSVQSPKAMIRHLRSELLAKMERRLGLLSVAQDYAGVSQQADAEES